MDVRTGIQLDGNGEFDAWRYVPQDSISVSSPFDWAHYQTWCPTGESWNGTQCAVPECVADGTCILARYIRIYKYNHAGVETTFQGAYEGIINLQELAVWSSVDPDVNLALSLIHI